MHRPHGKGNRGRENFVREARMFRRFSILQTQKAPGDGVAGRLMLLARGSVRRVRRGARGAKPPEDKRCLVGPEALGQRHLPGQIARERA